MKETNVDLDLIDETVLALMFLTLHSDGRPHLLSRAWKSFDWAALDRLHQKDMILDPKGKAKSVVLTEEGRRRCEEAFYRHPAPRPRQNGRASCAKRNPQSPSLMTIRLFCNAYGEQQLRSTGTNPRRDAGL